MKTISIVGVIIMLIVGVGYIATSQSTSPHLEQMITSETTETKTTSENQISSERVAPATTTDDLAISAGTYSSYDAAKIKASTAEHIILFFHASWCPTCRILDSDIKKNVASIPAGVEIYKIDYDTATELKRTYGVTRQHSIVEIDASGTIVGSISHPLTLAGVLDTI